MFNSDYDASVISRTFQGGYAPPLDQLPTLASTKLPEGTVLVLPGSQGLPSILNAATDFAGRLADEPAGFGLQRLYSEFVKAGSTYAPTVRRRFRP
jgi:hypothetical protein